MGRAGGRGTGGRVIFCIQYFAFRHDFIIFYPSLVSWQLRRGPSFLCCYGHRSSCYLPYNLSSNTKDSNLAVDRPPSNFRCSCPYVGYRRLDTVAPSHLGKMRSVMIWVFICFPFEFHSTRLICGRLTYIIFRIFTVPYKPVAPLALWFILEPTNCKAAIAVILRVTVPVKVITQLKSSRVQHQAST